MRILKVVSLMLFIAISDCGLCQSSTSFLQMDNPVIRVLISDSTADALITPTSPFSARTLEGEEILEVPPGLEISISRGDNSVILRDNASSYTTEALCMEPLDTDGSFILQKAGLDEKNPGRSYEGRLEIFPGEGGMLEVIIVLPMEKYLMGVVPYEIGPDSPIEAMCAQAVAARSEAFVALVTRKYAGKHHDICSDVNCQVFRGNERRSTGSDEAVTRTCGTVLLFEGQPVSAFYASNCGGHSEDIRNVWGDRSQEKSYWNSTGFDGKGMSNLDLTKEDDFLKWLDSSPDVFCNHEKYTTPAWTHKNFRWTREVEAGDLTKWISEIRDIGRITAMRPVKRGVSGRMIEVEFIGEKGTLIVGPELKIRRLFKPSLRSAAFIIDPQGPQNRPDRFILRGAGSGHGVGMCQTGAIGMANQGKSFQDILRHYFPRAEIRTLYK